MNRTVVVVVLINNVSLIDRFSFFLFSNTALWVAIHCTAIVHWNGFRNGWNWIMWSRASHDALSLSEWKTNSFYQRQPTNSSAKRKSVMRFCRNVMLATLSHARTMLSVWWRPIDNMSVAVPQASMVNIANTWLMLATEILAEIMERALFWKKVDSVANAYRATRALAVKSISMIATTTNVRTMEHVLMVSKRIVAVVCLVSTANFANRKFNFAEPISIHARTVRNVLTTSLTTLASVPLVSEASIAPRTLTIARITCVRIAELALMASMIMSANVQAISLESSARARQWSQWCIRKHRHAKTTNANLVSASSRTHRHPITFANVLPATPENAVNI